MIFYFSATGNCKNVAQILAERTGERAVAIADELIRAERDGGLRTVRTRTRPSSMTLRQESASAS